MTAWWEKPNPGGPMVGPPFTRPLYPPDAAKKGKQPSPPGDDIVAIKRAVSRSGHWPWTQFSGEMSNSFAHGKSGNVSENGLAGLQRQNNIDATGWMGEHTYNLIRSARIPAGLPHSGEPILDQVAVDLLNSYRKQQAGGGTLRELALAKARDQIGYTESPPGTNGNMYGAWYGLNYEPWCAIFVTWCYETSGNSPSFAQGSRYAFCPYVVSDSRAGVNGLTTTTDPKPGDLVVYDWGRDGVFDHIGFVESGTSFSWVAIEGNTSPDAGGDQSNGGMVCRKTRSASDANVVFVRVKEP